MVGGGRQEHRSSIGSCLVASFLHSHSLPRSFSVARARSLSLSIYIYKVSNEREHARESKVFVLIEQSGSS